MGPVPLRYYFELEQHFIDIIQCRSLKVAERLEFLAATIRAVTALTPDEEFGFKLNSLFDRNYALLDHRAEVVAAVASDEEPNMRLLEHYLVKFIFRSPFICMALNAP